MPVDMRGMERSFVNLDEMINMLGPTGAAKAFIKAKKYFDTNKAGVDEALRPQRMPAAKWRRQFSDVP